MASVADLILRAGRAQADRAARSGEIWQATLGELGRIGSRAYEGYRAQKDEERARMEERERRAAVERVFAETGGNPKYEQLLPILGERDAGTVLNAVANYRKANTPEPPKTRQINRRLPTGQEVIEIVEDRPGQSWENAPEPPKPEIPRAPTEAELAWKAAQGDKAAAQALSLLNPVKPESPKDERIVQIMIDGVPTWVRESEAVGKPAAQAARAVTGAERQALAYFNRAKGAVETIEPLEDAIVNDNLFSELQLQYAPNVLQTEGQAQYRQAQRAFTEARLRKESGAAIPTSEYENDAKTYFKQPGDTPAIVEQKRRLRAQVLEGLKFGAGRAYDEFYGEAPVYSQNPSGSSKEKPKPSGPSPSPTPGKKVGRFSNIVREP